MRRYSYFTDLDDWLWWARPTLTSVGNFNVYNPQTHDLVPKKDYLAEQLKIKEETLKRLKETKTDQIKELETEISDLKKSLSP